MIVHEANRMRRLPPYLFTVVDGWKHEVREKGVNVIDFSMGNPDFSPPKHVVEAMREALDAPNIHRYSKFDGSVEIKFRKAISDWYKNRFNVNLDPETEVLPCIGTKEGIAHLSLAFMNYDDLALVPSPAYPVHFNGVIMAGGILYNIPLKEEAGYLPDFFSLPKETVRLSKLLFLSYPHNPTSATCDLGFYEKVVKWVSDKNIIVASDLAYSDFVLEGKRAHSLLEVKDARKYAIEFHTLSKSYSMAGWRVGFAVGNKEILASLAKTKSYCDFGLFRAVQMAATRALSGPQGYVTQIVKKYKKRVDLFVDGLNRIGWETKKPKATFYVWTRIPAKFSALTSMEFTELLLREVGIAVAPGTGFGEYGEGYVRFALVVNDAKIKEAVARLEKWLHVPD
ncbi:MAG: alanine transaminase [Candidatus Omnitrophica bacterium CG11_big_fil_rev_8_21_14_0_20_45_26]|uniref:Alanine transaminase n=1 Tax=Candidatus Abzuiibacterium crystallinum TaxID=1974748 RepID=A0A2H0LS74_9BACT|nr:MAG: alanine transaminase [Candidatus Omnitrophica bacterium CG11_big_fil_rev_8_21_14_0_20_45_26]PIW64821.1 MAG: alanine transaminase [Candidatus Omnitrophica bacterium CG12_big_fil_rev_8_21_14_0_65_45_16]